MPAINMHCLITGARNLKGCYPNNKWFLHQSKYTHNATSTLEPRIRADPVYFFMHFFFAAFAPKQNSSGLDYQKILLHLSLVQLQMASGLNVAQMVQNWSKFKSIKPNCERHSTKKTGINKIHCVKTNFVNASPNHHCRHH